MSGQRACNIAKRVCARTAMSGSNNACVVTTGRHAVLCACSDRDNPRCGCERFITTKPACSKCLASLSAAMRAIMLSAVAPASDRHSGGQTPMFRRVRPASLGQGLGLPSCFLGNVALEHAVAGFAVSRSTSAAHPSAEGPCWADRLASLKTDGRRDPAVRTRPAASPGFGLWPATTAQQAAEIRR